MERARQREAERELVTGKLSSTAIEGALVRLRPISEDDVQTLLRWYTDPDVVYWLHASDRPALTEDEVRRRFAPAAASENEARWMIETLDGKTIGVVRLLDIDRECGRAELAIVVGEKEHWGEGYGTDAVEVALAHGFNELSLRRVWLITDADNERGIRCYEKCGFRREGVLRAHRTRYGEPLDMVMMGVLSEDRQTQKMEEE
jgi:RimJ/RimL family protein N-acetyltransferase